MHEPEANKAPGRDDNSIEETDLQPADAADRLRQDVFERSNYETKKKGPASADRQGDLKIADGEDAATKVVQGEVGSCFFGAALSAMANSKKGQKQINEMIAPQGDGSYTVTFPGDKNNPVNISTEELEKNVQSGLIKDNALWARIIENGFLKYDNAAQYGTGIDKLQRKKIPLTGEVSIFNPAKAIELLTGEHVVTDSLSIGNFDHSAFTLGSSSKESVIGNIKAALKNGDPVMASAVKLDWLKHLGVHQAGPMQGMHWYSVLDYDEKGETITVRNPWGTNPSMPKSATESGITTQANGKIKMPVEAFIKHFNSVDMVGSSSVAHDLGNVVDDVKQYTTDTIGAGSDLVTGDFDSALDKTSKTLKDKIQLERSILYATTDLGQRAGKFLLQPTIKSISNSVEIATDLAGGAADLISDNDAD